MFEIEKNIPIPKMVDRSVGYRQTLIAMAVGDSFLVTIGIESAKLANIRSHIRVTAKKLGIKVVTRAVDGNLRIWRIE